MGQVLNQGKLRATVTNWGFLGNRYRTIPDPMRDEPAPGLEYPARSGIDYLYDANLWVGGIVATDTLVTTGSRTIWARQEFFPDTGAGSKLVFTDDINDIGYRIGYADTISAPSVVPPDRYDGVHRPLDITVHQTCRGWVDTNYHDFLLISLVVTNVGAQTIQDTYVGWYVDPDIWHYDTPGGYADDLVGFRYGNAWFEDAHFPYWAAYAIDNDGDPDSTLVFTETSARGGLGLSLIGASPPPPELSFNWWFNSRILEIDWGPHKPGEMDIRGTPVGDTGRYRMMANGLIDYDQVYTAVDMTADGWAPPPDTSFFAAGGEMRFVYACGPFTLLPDDSVTLDFVVFLGEDIHTDPTHYLYSFDIEDPTAYLDGLSFGDWENSLAAAMSLREAGFTDAAPGPPQDFSFSSWTTTEVNLGWRPKQTFDLAGYAVFRRAVGGEFRDVPLATLTNTDSSFTDLISGLGAYEYAIRSFDLGGRYGPLSDAISVDLRRPLPVQIQRVAPREDGLEIVWQPSAYPDVDAYHITRRFISADEETTTVDLGATSELSFLDNTVGEAAIYEYFVTAESDYGLLSDPSAPVAGMRLAFDQGTLIIDETMADPSGFSNKDSVTAFWQRALPEATYRSADRGEPSTLTLMDFNPHPVTIVVSNGNFAETNELRDLLKDYFLAGGRVLLVGRDLFNSEDLASGIAIFGQGEFPYEYFGVTEAYYPATLLSHPTRINAEFAGAWACAGDLPDLEVDSARTDWGVPEELRPVGNAVPFVGWIRGDSVSTECLYTYQSRYGDTATSQGETTGLLFDNGRRRSAVLTFPPSAMSEPAMLSALSSILGRLDAPFAYTPGDVDGDGLVGPIDLAWLINYIFSGGPSPPIEAAADVDGDCRTNLVDVVILVNYIYRGGPAPVAGCTD